jgi:hypothetical protein
MRTRFCRSRASEAIKCTAGGRSVERTETGKVRAVQWSFPRGAVICTAVDSPLAKRMTFWIDGRDERLWLVSEDFIRDFERA